MSGFKLIKLSELEKILDDTSQPLDKPLVVLFKWEKCGVCTVNVPIIEKLLSSPEVIGTTYNYWIDVDKEDIWEEDQNNPRWQITVAPTYHVYDKNRKLVFEHRAFLSLEILKDVIQKQI
ncbi:hypothetical protein J2Z62_000188 [Mycoplasmoides fastidiosum]|uniref:Thioredoxin n=1 Tax=Mycoplasmoides fastidiosum TaxID=92758 RepID=A0ABU0LYS6_9BACT|nr:thioredoxin family protein [Mycoplasmoides fastidiosum]MDQ0513750.1 hypothetical protein [Mycoplasmoides fastidiosum]UUD37829.1 thioredoxin family protein [Mycoplasmoides fastidiosum]